MFAVLKTGGKQYKVVRNDVLIVEKLSAEIGDVVQFNQILMTGAEQINVGTPLVDGAAVQAEIIEQSKGNKVLSFVKRRRKHSSKRLRGHRQKLTVLRIQKILANGAKTAGEKIDAGVTLLSSAAKVSKKPIDRNGLSENADSKARSVKNSGRNRPAIAEKSSMADTTPEKNRKKESSKASISEVQNAVLSEKNKGSEKKQPTKTTTTKQQAKKGGTKIKIEKNGTDKKQNFKAKPRTKSQVKAKPGKS